MKRGDLVSLCSSVSEILVDQEICSPFIIVKGPYEGNFSFAGATHVSVVVDLFYSGKIIKGIPLSKIRPWVIESGERR